MLKKTLSVFQPRLTQMRTPPLPLPHWSVRKCEKNAKNYTYIQSLERIRLVYSGKTKPRTHVFDVELGNICEYFPLFGTDFVFRQTLQSVFTEKLVCVKGTFPSAKTATTSYK